MVKLKSCRKNGYTFDAFRKSIRKIAKKQGKENSVLNIEDTENANATTQQKTIIDKYNINSFSCYNRNYDDLLKLRQEVNYLIAENI